MEIKASDVKVLREKTGAGLMDCKKALVEANGDFETAERKLKEWGLAGVAKRAERATNEGRIFLATSKTQAAIVEIACETDFVCKNDKFIAGGNQMAKIALEKGYTEPADELKDILTGLASIIKENMSIKRVVQVKAENNQNVHGYLHGPGKLATVVTFEASKVEDFENSEIAAFMHEIALLVAANKPDFLDESCISQAWISDQTEIFKKLIENDEKLKGKPEKVIQGALTGKLKKLMKEICFMDQAFSDDGKISIQSAIADINKKTGSDIKIVAFKYMKVGDAE